MLLNLCIAHPHGCAQCEGSLVTEEDTSLTLMPQKNLCYRRNRDHRYVTDQSSLTQVPAPSAKYQPQELAALVPEKYHVEPFGPSLLPLVALRLVAEELPPSIILPEV